MSIRNSQRIATVALLFGLLWSPLHPATAMTQPATQPALYGLTANQVANLQTAQPAPVEPRVLEEIADQGQTNFWVLLNAQADLTSAGNLPGWEARGRFVYEELEETARTSQTELVALLNARGAVFQPFWVLNAIRVTGGSALVDELAARPEVAEILATRVYQIPEPVREAVSDDTQAVEWNIDRVRAPEVWSTFGVRGEDIVVANIDTGVQFDHPALVEQYRGNLGGGVFDHNYNWFDPSQVCGSPSLVPCDNAGHGTHTMGTMVGDDGDPGPNQIGVAPHARWIAAKGCEDFFCTDFALLASGQWILAPTDLNGENPRPDLRPHVVNNSWGGWPGDPFYQAIVQAWVAAGIFPAFSIGNSGPGCGSGGSPGDYPESYGVGAFDINDTIAYFSSRGPSAFDEITKPNLAAPGVDVRSSVPENGYAAFNGTSMAAPHVAGTVALMWSAAPALAGDIDGTRALLDQTAIDTEDLSCGGTPEVNNVWGEGRLDAFAAVDESPRGSTGTLQGTVTDSGNGSLLANATIQMAGPVNRVTTSDPTGQYSKLLPIGTYTVTAQLYGYYPSSDAGIDVLTDTITVHDIEMDPAPFYTVTGQVTDLATGWPLYARIDIMGYPGGTIWTDPVNGQYSLSLAAGIEYTFKATAWVPGYLPSSRPVGPLTGPQQEDFTLDADLIACIAPGYEPVFVQFDDFESGFDNWSMTGLWNPENEADACGSEVAPFPSSSNAAYYGIDGVCTYDNGFTNSGSLRLNNPVPLPASGIAALSMWSYEETECNGDCPYDNRIVELSTNNGTTWTQLGELSKEKVWYKKTYNLAPYLGNDVLVRFRFSTVDPILNEYFGWMVDNVGIANGCVPAAGGLVVGNVYDANTSNPVNKATVTKENGESVLTHPTPLDPGVDDGFYTLFAPPGPQTLTATRSGGYGTDIQTPTVLLSDTIRQDFNLPAGLLSADPSSLQVTLELGEIATVPFTLYNNGGVGATFELRERDGGWIPVRASPGASLLQIPGSFSTGWSPATQRPGRFHEGMGPILPRPEAPPWTAIAGYPFPIMDNTAAELEGLVYSLGGLDFNFNGLSSGFVYDPDANAWNAIASMNFIRQKPAAAFVDDLLYVVGGWDPFGNPVTALEIYDPGSDTWTSAASIPMATASAPGVSLDGLFYVIGGCADGFCSPSDQVYVYDPGTDAWSQAANYPLPISWNACGAIDGLIYCAGGVSGFSEVNRTYVYDPASDSWTQLANMPQTQWGMAYTVAEGMLWISSGVTADFSLVTNQTFVYDPVTDTWTADANANVAEYRGGSACGFYKIGGSTFGFSPTPDSEVYPGLTDCGAASDVPWLSEDPVSGSIEAQASQAIQVTFDASVPEVNQPGPYMAELKVKDNTPYSLPTIPVTMTVNAPQTWGKLNGVVRGLARCDAPGGPLSKASVEIDGVTVVKTDNSGTYSWWLEQGTYTLTVTASGYAATSLEVSVVAGATTTHDVDLRLDAPCGAESPAAFEATAIAGTAVTQTLTLTNSGAGALAFDLLETLLSLPALAAPPDGSRNAAERFYTPEPEGPMSGRSLAELAIPFENAPLAPESDWYAGLDLPGGGYHYARAQCYEQPNSFYAISGLTGFFNLSDKTWRYDALDNTWTELAPIPSGQEAPAAVCYQGKIYVMGGGGTDQFYIYDITTNTWTAGPPLPRPVEGAVAGAWNGEVYLIGGDDDFWPGSGVSDQVDVYDISADTWTGTGTPMPVPTTHAGVVQLGPHVYVVGGWGFDSPSANVNATQRYDMVTDTWELGPTFTSARADFALSATEQALYAIGGDANSGSFQDASTSVERLDLSAWPGGVWEALGDPLPVARTANNAGYCTSGFFDTQIWSLGGLDTRFFSITGDNRFLGRSGESCFSIYSNVPWLSGAPTSGLVAGDSTGQAVITFNASDLTPGTYHATLVLLTNDPGLAHVILPVTLTVVEPTFGLSVAPQAASMVAPPGTTVSYTLQVSNLGNIADTYTVTLSSNAWTTSAPPMIGPLSTGDSAALSVAVAIPEGTPNGESDTVAVTLTSQGDSTQTASATLITVSGWYRTNLPILWR